MSEVLSGFLTDNCKLAKIADHAAANTTDVTSAELDMAGFEGVVFFTSFGTAAANNLITVHGCATSGGSFAATTALVASGTSDEDVILDVRAPSTRYLKLVASRGTSTTCESMWALQYNARSKSQSSDLSGTANVAQFTTSPAA